MYTITQVLAMFGAYYKEGSSNMKDLIKQIYQSEETASYFRTMPTMSTVYDRANSILGEVLQPYQETFTEKGNITFTPERYILPWMKIDMEFIPDKLVQSWLGFLTGSGHEKEKYPFIKWFMENHLLPKMKEDFEMSVIWGGVYVAPTPGTAGAASTIMNGIKKQINDYITAATGINVIATGALSATDTLFVKQIEDWCDQVNVKFRNTRMQLFMNVDRATSYKRGVRASYNANWAQIQDAKMVDVVDRNVQIIGLPSMGSSQKIWMTPAENRTRPIRLPKNKEIIGTERIDRKVKLYTDWHEGVCFETPQWIWTNDLEPPA